MSRVRLVNGNMETLVANINAQLGQPLSKDEVALLRKEQEVMNAPMGGSLSDPAGMVTDAEGRFNDIEGEKWIARAKDLCQQHAIEDGRYTIPGLPDNDILIVLHPKKETVLGVNGEPIEVDHYVVFARERGGNGEVLDKPWDCYICKSAESRNKAPLPHKCWKLRAPRPNMVPIMFAKAHGIDDAEDLAKELRSAWQADREQEIGTTDWGSQMEIPFSSDYMAGMLHANPKVWSTLPAE